MNTRSVVVNYQIVGGAAPAQFSRTILVPGKTSKITIKNFYFMVSDDTYAGFSQPAILRSDLINLALTQDLAIVQPSSYGQNMANMLSCVFPFESVSFKIPPKEFNGTYNFKVVDSTGAVINTNFLLTFQLLFEE